MTPIPVAYLRRSAADAGSPGDISRDVQEQAVRDLAKREGHNGDLRIFTDWARSADEEKEAKRTEWLAMLKAVEAGEISTIYAYSLDRLVRSTVTFGKLLKATRDKGVRVVTMREGDLTDTGNPQSWAFGHLVSFFGEYELRMVKARAAGALARRRERGDFMGQAPFGHKLARDADGRIFTVPDPTSRLPAVLGAAREAPTVLGACRLLQERGIPAAGGGGRWSAAALTRILAREAPELLRPRGPTGRRGAGIRSPLTGLLKCHCGQTMTPNATRGQHYCNKGHTVGASSHGKVTATEANLMPWIRAEAARLRKPEAVQLGQASEEERASLIARRKALGWSVARTLLTSEDAEPEAAEIDEALALLDAQEQVVNVPDLDWSWEPAAINGVLRALWDHVQLDQAMRPIGAAWRVPEWRAE